MIDTVTNQNTVWKPGKREVGEEDFGKKERMRTEKQRGTRRLVKQ